MWAVSSELEALQNDPSDLQCFDWCNHGWALAALPGRCFSGMPLTLPFVPPACLKPCEQRAFSCEHVFLRLLFWVHCIGNSCEFSPHSLEKPTEIHHNSGVSAVWASYDGFLWVFPRSVVRIRVKSRTPYAMHAVKKSPKGKNRTAPLSSETPQKRDNTPAKRDRKLPPFT